jgi:hypothetical protein
MILCPGKGEAVLIRGTNSFMLVSLSAVRFPLCIETFRDETVQTVEEGDLIVVSAPEGGPLRQACILLELIGRFHAPLVVLPSGHPGSRRLKMVVSVGPNILASCSIQRGTHPEQHLICSSEELAGLHLAKHPEGVRIDGMGPGIEVSVLTPE